MDLDQGGVFKFGREWYMGPSMGTVFQVNLGNAVVNVVGSSQLPGQPATGLPLDGGMLNVKTFGATGNGVTDDTAAINATVAALPIYQTSYNVLTQIIYFPAGTYLVSDTIQRTLSNHRANTPFFGEDPTTTTIKLKDSCSGFTNAAAPKPVFSFSSGNIFGQSPNADTTGRGNEAFNCTLENITLDCGTGNVGAIGVDYTVHNIGQMSNVTIKTTGAAYAAIAIDKGYIGPGLVTDCTLTGPFQYGIVSASAALPLESDNVSFGIMLGFEHITITGTTVAAILNTQYNWAFRDITITCNGGYGVDITDATGIGLVPPAAANMGLITWIDGTIGGTGTAPINGSGGYRNWSNVKAVNFNGSINTDYTGVWVQGTKVDNPHWQLTIKNTPTPPAVATNTWYKIVAPTFPVDATAAIQAALNAATSPVCYLPWGYYSISGPITIPDAVQRIEFMYSNLALQSTGYNLFETTTTRTADLFINNMFIYNSPSGIGGSTFHWKVASKLIVRNSSSLEMVYRESTGGEIYMSNINSPHLEINGSAGVWCRQFNPEISSIKLYNYNTAPFWLFGCKVEQASTMYQASAASAFEWVGGSSYPGTVQTDPLVKLTAGGRFTGSLCVESLINGQRDDTIVNSLINGLTNNLARTSLPTRGAYEGTMAVNLCTDIFVPSIKWPSALVYVGVANGTTIATATLSTDYVYTGTPVWSLTSNPGGKYAINSSTGVVTKAAATTAGVDTITISCGGSLTFGASGSPSIAPFNANIYVSAVSGTYLDPTKKAASITISSSYTATAAATNSNGLMVLTNTSHSSGKFFFKITLNVLNGSLGTLATGIANSSQPFTDGHGLGEHVTTGSPNSVAWAGTNIYINGNGVFTSCPRLDTTNVGYIAVDLTAQKMWVSNDNTSWNGDILANQNPATGVGGVSISAVTGPFFAGLECDVLGNQLTADFSGTGAPTGFTGF